MRGGSFVFDGHNNSPSGRARDAVAVVMSEVKFTVDADYQDGRHLQRLRVPATRQRLARSTSDLHGDTVAAAIVSCVSPSKRDAHPGTTARARGTLDFVRVAESRPLFLCSKFP